MSATLDRIIEEVRQLPPDEQRQLIEQLNAIVPASPNEDELEDMFERELAAAGVIGAPRERQNNCVSGITECKLEACRKGENVYADYTPSLRRVTQRV